MIRDMINTSRGKNDIMMSDEVNEMFVKLRKFMFERNGRGRVCKKYS